MIKLICGRSRAGKTTYSKQFADVIHLDYCGGILTCYDKVNEKVSCQDGDVIVEGIYDTAEKRTALLNAYKGEGKKICIWLDTPIDVIEARYWKWKPRTFPTPFEPPTSAEGWDEIIIRR